MFELNALESWGALLMMFGFIYCVFKIIVNGDPATDQLFTDNEDLH